MLVGDLLAGNGKVVVRPDNEGLRAGLFWVNPCNRSKTLDRGAVARMKSLRVNFEVFEKIRNPKQAVCPRGSPRIGDEEFVPMKFDLHRKHRRKEPF